jgi:hypothetical protein
MPSHFKELKGLYELEQTALKIYMNFLHKVINYLSTRVREVSFFNSPRPFPKREDPSSPILFFLLELFINYSASQIIFSTRFENFVIIFIFITLIILLTF